VEPNPDESFCCNLLIGYRARRTDWTLFMVVPVTLALSSFLISDIDSPVGGIVRVLPQNLMRLSHMLIAQ
jgi:hypothetical protein